MTDSQRLWRGLFIAVFIHLGILAGLMLAGFLTPPPPAPMEEPAEVSMLDEQPADIPEPIEDIAAPVSEAAEPAVEPVSPPIEPEKAKALPKSKPVAPPQPKEKPPLPTGDKKNLFDTDADVEKAFIAPILDKRQEPVFPPGTTQPTQPFVAIDVIIGKDGRVEKAAVSVPSGSSGVDQAALESVKKYLFIPGKDKQGKPIRCSFSITLIL